MHQPIVALLATAALAAAACSAKPSPAPAPHGLAFDKQILDPQYRTEGVAVFDVDRDGRADVVTDQTWYAGPDLVPHEIRAPQAVDPATQLCDALAIYPTDVDGDGWTDVVVAERPTEAVLWYANPAGRDEHWAVHTILPDQVEGIENPILVDLFGDGHVALLMTDAQQGILGWYTPAADPTAPWTPHVIVGPHFPGAAAFTHGLGAGDVDGDGRLDVLTKNAWYQQTSDRAAWVAHAFDFGGADECSRMWAFDASGDGRADVFCAHPHSYGFHWFEQQRADDGSVTFVDHDIDETLSEMHSLRLEDLDGDGVPELLSGKRWWVHGPTGDPGASDPALLVYYALRRDAVGGATFERHVIDDDSGAGIVFAVGDVNADGKVDVVEANKKGLILFRQR